MCNIFLIVSSLTQIFGLDSEIEIISKYQPVVFYLCTLTKQILFISNIQFSYKISNDYNNQKAALIENLQNYQKYN